jgi:hypothetical protein
MCQLCNGTHVVYEVDSLSIRTSCCPQCGPESDEVWKSRIENIIADFRKKKEELGWNKASC